VNSTVSVGLMILRAVVGVVFVAHGWNHIFGGDKIAGTGQWFSSLGMRPGILHAWVASVVELGTGVLLMLGLLTPLAGSGIIGLMLVAWITNHAKNGFFIFRPGEGYEYVMTLTACGLALSATGGGEYSLDRDIGFLKFLAPPTWTATLVCWAVGILGALTTLAVFWRPNKIPVTQATASVMG
jgi:putative oxidoreductase